MTTQADVPGLDIVQNNRRAVLRSARDLQLERARIYAACFSTDDGRWVLEDLKCRLARPVARAGKPMDFAHQREGENNLIREIVKTIDYGSKT